MIYEIINPSDACTIAAESDLIAWVAVLELSGGRYNIAPKDGSRSFPFFPLGPTNEGVAKVLRDEFCETRSHLHILMAHIDEFITCFDSFVYGSFSERELYDKEMTSIPDNIARAVYKTQHRNAHHNSLNNIGALATSRANAAREMKARPEDGWSAATWLQDLARSR